jgi:PTH1 family peptidyl-tRNA hydrolase
MFLVVGLGNIGQEYLNTRHNIGFMVLDEVLQHYQVKQITKKEFKGELYRFNSLFFLKPHTFMNLSGESVTSVRKYFNIDNLIIIHDDIDLPFGAIRFKKSGGTGGHNGLKSLDNWSQENSIRIKMGVGKPTNQQNIAKFVLDNFNSEEEKCLSKFIQIGSNAIIEILNGQNWEKIASLKSQKSAVKFCK